MSAFKTHKTGAEGKARTLALKARRRDKYATTHTGSIRLPNAREIAAQPHGGGVGR